MAQTRAQIAEVIEGLNVGDLVRVTWRKRGNTSVESGKVWDPNDSDYLGLGPDLLNPEDPELIAISVSEPIAAPVPEPPEGSVAVFVTPNGRQIQAYKRDKKGWFEAGPGANTPQRWIRITAKGRLPRQVFRPGVPPEAPTIDSVTAGFRSAAVVSTLGGSGSSAIIDVEYRLIFEYPSGEQGNTPWTSTGQTSGNFTINNLTGGMKYLVRVRAVNSTGPGGISNLEEFTPTGVPSAPTSLTATPGDTQVELSWLAPAETGGSDITGYWIEKGVPGPIAGLTTSWSTVIANTESTDLTYTVTGLTNGDEYLFRVSAINANGPGPGAVSETVSPSAP